MLIETDLAGGPVRVDDLDRDSVLWFAEQAKAREAAAALAVLHATIRWCETNTVDDPKLAAGFGEVGGRPGLPGEDRRRRAPDDRGVLRRTTRHGDGDLHHRRPDPDG